MKVPVPVWKMTWSWWWWGVKLTLSISGTFFVVGEVWYIPSYLYILLHFALKIQGMKHDYSDRQHVIDTNWLSTTFANVVNVGCRLFELIWIKDIV